MFMARLSIRGSRNSRAFCGASLISKKFLETAKHCFFEDGPGLRLNFYDYCYEAKDCIAVIGEHFLDVIDPGEQRISIIDVHQVPGDNTTDLLIIELEEEVELNDRVGLVSVSNIPLEAGDIVTTAGWGPTKAPGTEHSNVLRKAVLKVELKEKGSVYTTVEVVDGVPVDPCGGDSGGPLLVWEQGEWRLKAVLYGGGYVCTRGTTEGPGQWASVTEHYPWIQSLIKKCSQSSCGVESSKCRNDFQCLPLQSCEETVCNNVTITSQPQCTTHKDCLETQSCVQTTCRDPCTQPGVCGSAATCRPVNHRAVCSCPKD